MTAPRELVKIGVAVLGDGSHPPYYFRIHPSYNNSFHLFKAFLGKEKFIEVEDFEGTVSDLFDFQSLQLWNKGMADLSSSWETVVVNGGENIVD